MSGWISAFAGGMVGGGNALQTYARDEAEAERRMQWEQMREKAAMDRQERLLALQQQYRKEERDREMSPETTAQLADRQRALEQAKIDTANDPNNVSASLRTRALIDDATPYVLGPGQQKLKGGVVVGENKRETPAEVQARLYAEGLKGQEKLPPAYVSAITRIEKERGELDKSIRGLEEKVATDPLAAGDAAQKQLNAWKQQRAMLMIQAERAAIENGLIDPVKRANDMVAAASSLDELNTMLAQAKRAGGSDWARQLGDAIEKNGNMRRFDKGAAESPSSQPGKPGDVSVSPPMDETPAESGRLGRGPGILQRELESIDTRPTDLLTPKGRALIDGAQQFITGRDPAEARNEQSLMLSRTREIQGITPESARAMSTQEAQAVLTKFNTELPRFIREILESKVR